MSRKPDPKKTRKQKMMWIEQIYYKLDEIEKRINELEKRLEVLEE